MGKERTAGRIGPNFWSAIVGRVNVLPGRVGSKKSDPWTTLVWIWVTNGLIIIKGFILLKDTFFMHCPQICTATAAISFIYFRGTKPKTKIIMLRREIVY